MKYLSLDELNQKLKNVPKDTIIVLLHSYLQYRGDTNIDLLIIDAQIGQNLNKQQEAAAKLNLHKPYSGTDHAKWIKNHEEWDRLYEVCKKLDVEYEALSKRREKLTKDEQ
jgi:hypothetical protein